ncbi:hypothetical protein CesoFtcFv8_001461 [Champsocephalus esox]|uniref:Uncharacterized protein n=1 Tax=Champsocephalus esox TaxID=159716 RepID=A0AAN8DDY1_9TELE|nr:hypothetical protein CesoFtcFv8_001461 [Champsocephalus esox]
MPLGPPCPLLAPIPILPANGTPVIRTGRRSLLQQIPDAPPPSHRSNQCSSSSTTPYISHGVSSMHL